MPHAKQIRYGALDTEAANVARTVGRFRRRVLEMEATREGDLTSEGLVELDDLEGLAELLASGGGHEDAVRCGDVCAVARVGDVPVGLGWLRLTHHVDRHYGAWSAPDERTAYLNQLFVAPAARGEGIATMLIDDLLLHAGKADRQVVRCLVAPDNTASLRAFERSGAVPIADLRGLRLGSRWTLRLSRRFP